MSLRLGPCRVKIHPLLPLLWLAVALTGMGERLPPMLTALALHEAGHGLAALGLGIRVDELEITPLGGLMTVTSLEEVPPLRRFLLAAAGPAASLCGCLLATALYRQGTVSFGLTGAFLRANLALLLINLLPALPLDGGQMLRAALSRFLPPRRMERGLTLASSVIGLMLCGLSLAFALQGKLALAPAFAGLYLIYAAAMEGRHGVARYVTSLIARRQKLDRQAVLPVETVAAGAGTPVRSLLFRLSPGKYHMIHVLSPDGMTRLGVIEERDFCEAVLNRSGQSLGTMLWEKSRKEKAGEMSLASRNRNA